MNRTIKDNYKTNRNILQKDRGFKFSGLFVVFVYKNSPITGTLITLYQNHFGGGFFVLKIYMEVYDLKIEGNVNLC